MTLPSFESIIADSVPGQWQRIELPYPPSLNNMYPVVRGRHILSAEGRRFKQRVSVLALAAGMRPLGGDVACMVKVFRPRKAGDLDNTLKAILDSLKGVAFHDDRQVVQIHAWRGDDNENPRAIVTIAPATNGGQLFTERMVTA